jgi:hypothetical protein
MMCTARALRYMDRPADFPTCHRGDMAGMEEECSRGTFMAATEASDLLSHKVTRTVRIPAT